MRARDLASQVPMVEMDLPAVEAARLIADQCLPGLIVLDGHGRAVAVLPGVEVLRLVVPAYLQDSTVLARVIDEGHADLFPREVGGRTVGQCLPDLPSELPVVNAGATVVEIAVLMARTRSPLVVVVDPSAGLLGAVTLDSLMKRMFAS